ncbi:MAG: bifunctional phosphoribosylaminoimidazolecarboxamide formyltransferase/IMP cyclohydrolase [Sphingomonadales bacterium]|nr:bifunctional phosphoribosylaminoimidazolecarboxamide formyltransferase/IMP cyclohydrolase [Sphingomonadales bacterium]
MPQTSLKSVRSALLSVYSKEGLLEFAKGLQILNIQLIASGGTYAFLRMNGLEVTAVEELTSYGEMLGGRVKTLHPHIFGGILARRSQMSDLNDLAAFQIPLIDLVVVDLYPFEQAVSDARSHDEIIEKIDIGGVALLRAAAKNYEDVAVVSSPTQYSDLLNALGKGIGITAELRKDLATAAFQRTTDYDHNISQYISGEKSMRIHSALESTPLNLRYGENPQQEGRFYGDINQVVEVIGGKQLSYNNLLDLDSALSLLADLPTPSFAVIKHNNPCGVAHRASALEAWEAALAGDPVSAFGGIIASNHKIDGDTAREIDKIFYEILVAPDYTPEALELLQKKKNRILLRQTSKWLPSHALRSALNGILWQTRDEQLSGPERWKLVTQLKPDPLSEADLEFAERLVKHTKSNAIVLIKNRQLIGSGMGQSSRIEALRQAVHKARSFGFDLTGTVMASDAFFPFADTVEAAYAEGIMTILQPGGSLRDQESIDFCDQHGMAMVCTGLRHFKH